MHGNASQHLNRFHIISVDDSRQEIKAKTRGQLLSAGWKESETASVDGRDPSQLEAFMNRYSVQVDREWNPNVGTLGYWGSLAAAAEDVLNSGPMLIIEDDAEIAHNAIKLIRLYLKYATDIDAFQCFTLVNQPHPYADHVPASNDIVVYGWHQWPLGAIVLFESGAAKIIERLSRPLDVTGDVFVSNMNVASPAPGRQSPFSLRHGEIPSTIDGTVSYL